MSYNLRPATYQDLPELEFRYEQVMRPYVELTHQWNPDHFRKNFDPNQIKVITVNGDTAGLLKVKETRFDINLLDIQLWPEYQYYGIGSAILTSLIERSNRLGLPITLRVLIGNPARNLYQRLGFYDVELISHAIAMRRDPN